MNKCVSLFCVAAVLSSSLALPVRRKRQATDLSAITNLFSQAFQGSGSGGLLGNFGPANILSSLSGGGGGSEGSSGGLLGSLGNADWLSGLSGGENAGNLGALFGENNGAASGFLSTVDEILKGLDFGKIIGNFFGGNSGGGSLGGFDSLLGGAKFGGLSGDITPAPTLPPTPPPTTAPPIPAGGDRHYLQPPDLSKLNLSDEDMQTLIQLLGANPQLLPSPDTVLARMKGYPSYQVDAPSSHFVPEAVRKAFQQENRFFKEVHLGDFRN